MVAGPSPPSSAPPPHAAEHRGGAERDRDRRPPRPHRTNAIRRRWPQAVAEELDRAVPRQLGGPGVVGGGRSSSKNQWPVPGYRWKSTSLSSRRRWASISTRWSSLTNSSCSAKWPRKAERDASKSMSWCRRRAWWRPRSRAPGWPATSPTTPPIEKPSTPIGRVGGQRHVAQRGRGGQHEVGRAVRVGRGQQRLGLVRGVGGAAVTVEVGREGGEAGVGQPVAHALEERREAPPAVQHEHPGRRLAGPVGPSVAGTGALRASIERRQVPARSQRVPVPYSPTACDLCEAARITPWFHEDDLCWIAECEICATPMVVLRGPRRRPGPGGQGAAPRAARRGRLGALHLRALRRRQHAQHPRPLPRARPPGRRLLRPRDEAQVRRLSPHPPFGRRIPLGSWETEQTTGGLGHEQE